MDRGDGAWDGPVPAWLAEVREFRAEILHNGGLRPAFHRDGRFCDDDPADPFAHHVVARVDGAIVATLRIVPLAATAVGFCERMFGTAVIDRVLAQVGVTRKETWEGSGWAVEPTRRGAAMGPRVLAAGSAAARGLGLTTAIGSSGKRYGQLYRILAAGYRCAEGVDPVGVDSLADDVQLVHGRLVELEPAFQRLVEDAQTRLTLIGSSPTQVKQMTS